MKLFVKFLFRCVQFITRGISDCWMYGWLHVGKSLTMKANLSLLFVHISVMNFMFRRKWM